MEFEIQFNDVTLLEANGKYRKVCDIMKKEVTKTSVASFRSEWMLRSKVSILSPFGYCTFVCHFYNNGKVYIADYMPSTKDVHNTDVRSLTYWCNENGWKTPEPLPTVAESWLNFWKKEWETHIIDSDYFDNRYGVRKELQFGSQEENDDNDDED
jgi:hypothetical protein